MHGHIDSRNIDPHIIDPHTIDPHIIDPHNDTTAKTNAATRKKKLRLAFAEVRRKLLLALETTTKQDRDVVCAEVFADITGRLHGRLQDELHYTRWYEALSSHLDDDDCAADEVLSICKRLGWGQVRILW